MLNEYMEYEVMGGPEGLDEYWEYISVRHIPDEDGEIAYEAMLDRQASYETEIDARNGV